MVLPTLLDPTRHPEFHEPRSELVAICAALRDQLAAQRVTVWRHHAAHGTVSPFAGSEWDHDPGPLEVAWARTPLAEIHPFAEAVQDCRPVFVANFADGSPMMARLAGDVGLRSAWCTPLLLGSVRGIAVVEPAEAVPDRLGAATAGLLASAAAVLAWQQAERAQAQAEFFLGLAETATNGPLGPVLARACEGLARLLGVQRGSIFLLEDDRLVPRMSRYADGSLDRTAWEQFRNASSPPELASKVLEEGRLIVADRSTSSLISGWWAETFSLASALAVPIEWGSQPLGVLMLDTDRRRRFGEEHLRLTAGAGKQLGSILGRAREAQKKEQDLLTATSLRRLLEAGVRACSPLEAAEVLASSSAAALGVPKACAYLVDQEGRICEIATVGANAAQAAALRKNLLGAPAAGSPVFRRVVEGAAPGPDLVEDTATIGKVRPGGVAECLELRSMAAIPLMSSEGPLGMVLCGDVTPRRRWPSTARQLLTHIALQGAVVLDNARLRQAERYKASYDLLTGLANRQSFGEHLEKAVARVRRDGTGLAVVLADLDRFKEVNDTLGHHQGDALLVEVGRRLVEALREADIVARLGGDEFTAILVGVDRAGAEAAACRIAAALAAPIELGDLSVGVEASIGVACYPDHGVEADELLRHADVAMYTAKQGGISHKFYDPANNAFQSERLALFGELRHALSCDQLVLHYQPKVDLRLDEVVGVEALVRWQHPRLGLLAPAQFIPLAEATGLVRALTAWVAARALAQCAEWRASGMDLPVSVNASARDLVDKDFPDRVAGWLSEAGVPADRLVVELTESALMSDRVAGVATLQRLRSMGVKVSLDDFGTGYSSLAYLESLPLDEVKIDRSFLLRGMTDPEAFVVRSIIGLGHHLGLTVVAEGVEADSAPGWLASMGCDQLQGFVYAPPLPPEGLRSWLARRAGDTGRRRTNPQRSDGDGLARGPEASSLAG